jgi:TonB family protein
MTFLAEQTILASVLLILGLLANRVVWKHPAALRHGILVTVFTCVALLPLLSIALPRPEVHSPPRIVISSQTPATTTVDAFGASPLPPLHIESRPLPWSELMLIVWASGVVVGLVRRVAGTIQIQMLTSKATPLENGRWQELLGRVSLEHRLNRRVQLLLTSDASILATWGCLRSCILLPPAATEWPEHRVRSVLCHELAHVRRQDWLVQQAAECLLVLHWFNPLAWLACRRLRQEAELACDDAVLRMGVSVSQYSRDLIDIARSQTHGAATLPAQAMAHLSTFERRFAAMLNPAIKRHPISRSAIVALVLLAISISLPLATLSSGATIPPPAMPPIVLGAPPAPVAAVTIAAAVRPARTASKVQSTTGIAGGMRDFEGNAVGGGTIILSMPDGQTAGTFSTSPAGAFSITGLGPGQYVVQAFAPGFSPSSATTVEVIAGRVLRQDVSLGNRGVNANQTGLGVLSGTVVDPTGAFVPQVNVSLTGPGAVSAVRKTATNEAGRYLFDRLPAGSYTLTFEVAGFNRLMVPNVAVVDDVPAYRGVSLEVGSLSEVVTITARATKFATAIPDTAPRPPQRIRQGGNVVSAKLLNRVQPVYPQEALDNNVQGVVMLEAVVRQDGGVDISRVVSGHPLLTPAVLQAVRQWRYDPAKLNGEAVATEMSITIGFGLSK